MTNINLKNITKSLSKLWGVSIKHSIREKEDKNLNKYYLIIDNETEQAYFCFEKAVKEGWNDLVQSWESLKEIELEFETNERGNNKVVSVFVNKEGGVFL